MGFKCITGAICIYLMAVSFNTNAAMISGQGTWETTLIARDLDGNNLTAEAYYDTEFNITWLADANVTNGALTWDSATSLSNFYGTAGWRLPNTYGEGLVAGWGPVDPASELSHLYYDVLGNESGILSNTGPFSNVQPNIYYSSTKYYTSGNPDTYVYCFVFSIGRQGICDFGTTKRHYAWYVNDGDIGGSVVPIPSAIWLFGSGFIGLIGVARRKARV